MNSLPNRIVVDPNVCNGKPTFKNRRIAVQTILEFLASGDSIENVLEAYPSLETKDILAAFEFAGKLQGESFNMKFVS